MSSTKCINCKSNLISNICPNKCNCIMKKCDYCSNEFDINECNGIAYNPYWFCSSTHYQLASPRIKYGVIGGPVGGPRGKPRGRPIGQIKKPEFIGQAQPILNCPPPIVIPQYTMRRSITPPPGLSPPPMIYAAPPSPIPIYMGVPFNHMQQYIMHPVYFFNQSC